MVSGCVSVALLGGEPSIPWHRLQPPSCGCRRERLLLCPLRGAGRLLLPLCTPSALPVGTSKVASLALANVRSSSAEISLLDVFWQQTCARHREVSSGSHAGLIRQPRRKSFICINLTTGQMYPLIMRIRKIQPFYICMLSLLKIDAKNIPQNIKSKWRTSKVFLK